MKRNLLFLLVLIFITTGTIFGQALDEDFESGTFPPTGWTEHQLGDPAGWSESSSQSYSPSYSAFHNDDNVATGCDDWLITPVMDLSSYTLPQLTYWEYVEYPSWADENNVYYSTDYTGSGDPSVATWILIDDAIGTDSWTEKGPFNLPTSSTVYVAFEYVGDYASEWYIDDVLVDDAPTCPAPSNQSETNITASSVELSWTTGGSSTWNIEYGPTGFTQGTGTMITDVTSNPYTLGSLSASTTYDWYIQDSCGVGDVSSWVGPSTFTTACATFSTPFSEDFSSSLTPNCWANDSTEHWLFSTGAGYGASSAGDHTTGGGTNYAWIDGSSGVNANALYTPFIDISSLTVPEIKFYYFSNNTNNPGDDNTLIVDFWDGATWNNLLTYAGDDASWQEAIYDLSGYTVTGDVQFRFYVNGTASTTFYNDILIDDILVHETPACPAPTGLTTSNETTTTVQIAWNPASSSNGYNWEIVPLGDGQGNNVVASGSTSDTTVTVNSLTPGTSYDFYVNNSCGSTGSIYSGPVSFSTACAAKITSFPYSTDFENDGSIPNCWTNDPNDAGGEWKFKKTNSHGPTEDHTTGSGYYALLDDYLTSSSSSPFNLLTPTFDLSTADKWYKVSYWVWIGEDGATNPIYFEISLDGGNTWKTLKVHDHSTTGSWFKTEMDLGFSKSDNVVFRFKANSIYGYYEDNSGIDDFTIEETQAPPVPLSDYAVYIGVFFILVFLVTGYRRKLA